VPLGIEDGLKHDSSIHCDNLISLQKSALTNFIVTLSAEKTTELNRALAVALDLPPNLLTWLRQQFMICSALCYALLRPEGFAFAIAAKSRKTQRKKDGFFVFLPFFAARLRD
jgi:hypothetical protein